MWCLVGILPTPPTARELRQFRDLVGHTWLLRADATRLPRTGGAAAEGAAETALQAGKGPLALALLLIARAGSRASDAVRIAAGFVDAYELAPGHLVVFPTSEKTDQMGARVIEPLVLPWPEDAEPRWRPIVTACLGGGSASSTTAAALRQTVTRALRRAGVADARGPRRELAERVAAAHGRARAGLVLRHAKDAAVTARYTTTRDAVPTLLSTLGPAQRTRA